MDAPKVVAAAFGPSDRQIISAKNWAELLKDWDVDLLKGGRIWIHGKGDPRSALQTIVDERDAKPEPDAATIEKQKIALAVINAKWEIRKRNKEVLEAKETEDPQPHAQRRRVQFDVPAPARACRVTLVPPSRTPPVG